MLYFMSENKRILNMHEKKFSELANFQAFNCVSDKYQCLFEEFGDSDKVAGFEYAESV